MTTDISLSSKAQLVEVINNDNNIELPLNAVEFTDITPLEQDPEGVNTEVTVAAIANTGYRGSVTVKYNRNNLNLFTTLGEPDIYVSHGDTLEDVITKFNGIYGSNLELGIDINPNVELPSFTDEGEEMTLVAQDISPAYYGSIDVNVKLSSIPLAEVITISTLNGLSWPIVEGPSLLGVYTTVGEDVVLNATTTTIYHFSHKDPDGTIVFGGTAGSLWRRYNPSTKTVSNNNITVSYIGYGFKPLYLASDNTYRTIGGVNAYRGITRLNVPTGSYIDTIPFIGDNVVNLYNQGGGINIYGVMGQCVYYLGDGNLWCRVDLESGEYTLLGPMPLAGVNNSESLTIALNDKIYVYIDNTKNDGVISQWWCYDVHNATWSQLASPPARLINTVINSYKNEIYINVATVASSIMYRYTPSTDTWFTYTDAKPSNHIFGLLYSDESGIHHIGGRIDGIIVNTHNLIT